jgi:hypothetical protein
MTTDAYVPYEVRTADGGSLPVYQKSPMSHGILARMMDVEDVVSTLDEWYSITETLLKNIRRNSSLDKAIIFFGKGHMETVDELTHTTARSAFLNYFKVLESLGKKAQFKNFKSLRNAASHTREPEEKIAGKFLPALQSIRDAAKKLISKKISEEYGLSIQDI